MRFLIIDDAPKNSLLLKRFLEEEAFVVDHVTDANRGRYLAKINEYDLLIINQTQPGEFARKLCTELRKDHRDLPIIEISAFSDLEHRLNLFSAGIDDCLSQPFSLRELLARIRAILRRGASVRPDILTASGIVLNCSTQRVRSGRKNVSLSKKEFSILELLMRNKGSIVSRSVILEHVWDMKRDPFSNSLDAHIFTLRRKLGRRRRSTIQNVQGRGYLIED